MKTTLFTTTLVSALLLSACGQKEYTVDFLKENNDIRSQVLADCKANKQTDSNCKNANDAERAVKTAEYTKRMFGR